jgi:uncharacterized protein involved in exopolysaccharide biosynthesis
MTGPMAAPEPIYDDQEISLYLLATILLRRRRHIAGCMAIGAVVAALSVIGKPQLYRASASFLPQATDGARDGGLANLAGQFGVSLPSSGGSQSPDFYARLLRSRVILEPLVRDTLAVAEMGGKHVAIVDLLSAPGATDKVREENGIERLRSLINPSVNKSIGEVGIGVTTQWPSVSLAIVKGLLGGVNDFNQRARQIQAGRERKFIDSLLVAKRAELRAAEDSSERFQSGNSLAISPALTKMRDRIQRDLLMKQQVYTSLAQAYEDARIREVRDTPLITLLDPPSVPSVAEPRRRVQTVVVGLLLGGFIGSLLFMVSTMTARRREQGNADATEFSRAVGEVSTGLTAPVRWLTGRRPR